MPKSKDSKAYRPRTKRQSNHGYHLTKIEKGEVGEVSKIREELVELEDALSQGSKVMALVELSDLYGAIDLYLKRHFPGVGMSDLETMSAITQRAFINGRRQ